MKETWLRTLSDLNICSKKGLVEMFDSSIGAATVLMPYGGKTQDHANPDHGSELPVMEGKTDLGHHDVLWF